MTVMFRCDAGADHGLGHLSRCVTIADAVAERGGDVRFHVHADDALRVFAGNHEWHAMPWGIGSDGDVPFMRGELDRTPNSIIVVDGKRAAPDYVSALRDVRPVAQIVDEDPRESSADLVINNHPAAERYEEQARFLLGARYNTVRASYFAAASKADRNAILITMGGEDPHNHTAWTLNNLGDLFAGRPVMVVVGPAHPDPQAVERAVAKIRDAEIHRAPRDLVVLAERADAAISAGGTTCYELAAAGVAVAAIAVEPHQRSVIEPLAERGTLLPLGGPDVSMEAARSVVERLLARRGLREELARSARLLFSAPGAPRIADALFELGERART